MIKSAKRLIYEKGKFELANKGTLLLDEIGDMPLQLQTRFLRVLEGGKVSRIGGEKDISLDVRVIAATHTDLKQKIAEGLFREDLYYRLNILNIALPSLRERKEDISLLAWHFLQRVLIEVNYKPPYPYLSQETIQLLEQHNWSGNVRELKNLMTKIAVLLPSGIRKIEPARIKKSLFQYISKQVQNENLFQVPLGFWRKSKMLTSKKLDRRRPLKKNFQAQDSLKMSEFVRCLKERKLIPKIFAVFVLFPFLLSSIFWM